MSEIDRAELRRLAEAASPGPWAVSDDTKRGRPYCVDTPWSDATGSGLNLIAEVHEGAPRETLAETDNAKGANAAFIAASRTAVPALLDALDAAEAERDDFDQQVQQYRERNREVVRAANLSAAGCAEFGARVGMALERAKAPKMHGTACLTASDRIDWLAAALSAAESRATAAEAEAERVRARLARATRFDLNGDVFLAYLVGMWAVCRAGDVGTGTLFEVVGKPHADLDAAFAAAESAAQATKQGGHE